MLRAAKGASLQVLKASGVFRAIHESEWRRQRLLILCYHCTPLDDEYLWRPGLYMSLPQLEQRLEAIKRGGYRVLPLTEALQRLRRDDLPKGSVCLTFDDGTYDFYKQVYPLLRKYGFPVTVYQTTYYSDRQMPIFNLLCSYLLWKRKGEVLDSGKELGLQPPLDLRSATSRQELVVKLLTLTQKLSGAEKNELAQRLAELLSVDYQALVAKRIFHLMTPEEISHLAQDGVDFQLHTHRHRTPKDAVLFGKEIRENRERLREITGQDPRHFCYPSGVYEEQFLPWLAEQQVVSATTCDISLASVAHNPLLLPRFIDTPGRSQIEYESWLSGVGHILSRKKAATQKFVPTED